MCVFPLFNINCSPSTESNLRLQLFYFAMKCSYELIIIYPVILFRSINHSLLGLCPSMSLFKAHKDPAKTPATTISTIHKMTFVVSPVWGLMCCLWMEEEGVELPPLGVDELPPPPPEEGVVVFVPFGASTMATFWISPVSFTINLTSSATSYPLGAVTSRRV